MSVRRVAQGGQILSQFIPSWQVSPIFTPQLIQYLLFACNKFDYPEALLIKYKDSFSNGKLQAFILR